MDNYEDQPADVLLRDLFDLGVKGKRTVDDEMEYNEDIAAIKVAVIREASIGTLTVHAGMFGQTYGDKPITSFNEGDRCALVLLPKEA